MLRCDADGVPYLVQSPIVFNARTLEYCFTDCVGRRQRVAAKSIEPDGEWTLPWVLIWLTLATTPGDWWTPAK